MIGRVRFKNLKSKSEDEDTDPNLLTKSVTVKENRLISNDYIIGEYLGSGKFGEVKRCEEKNSGGHFAAKFVPVACKEDMDAVRNEIEIMNRLRHPRLIQLYDAYAYKNEVVMVLELITGGELFERIIDESFELNEARCIRFMNEILQGVQYIHAQGVLHLDLKPENILCLSKSSFKIKIIDFGLARFYNEKEICVLFGTPEFVSPEVISYDPVTPAADMWSIGVICYVMLSGLSPFMGDSQGETLANILRVTYDFNYPEFDEISEDARDFIRKLLVKDARKRLSATDCLQHPWMTRKKQLQRKGTVSKKRLKHFVYRRKWQKAVNAIIALLRMGVVLHHEPTAGHQDATTVTKKEAQSVSKPKTNKPPSIQKVSNDKKERRMSSIFTKLTPKRVAEDESKSSTTKSTPARRPSLLGRFSRKEKTESVQNANKQVKTSLKQAEQNPKGNTQPGKGIQTANQRNAPTCLSPIQPQEIDSRNEKQTGGSEITHKLDSRHAKTQKELGPTKHGQSNSTTNKTSQIPKNEAATQSEHKEVKLNKSVAVRKIAPATGGIASKINFFSNLQEKKK